MAGVSDPALRLLCKKMGAGLVVTEFTSIHSIIAKDKELRRKQLSIRNFLEYSNEERPLSIQLFGSDITALEKATRIVSPHFDIIDYNMGCPAPHITSQMAGGALLQEPNLTRTIFRTLVHSSEKPISLKIRSGVTSKNNTLFVDIAKIAEEEGIRMITLHPRTVSQGYGGMADWNMIKKLKSNVKIPVVGNGDVTSPELAKKMLDYTGCDFVMIGRGAMGNPFLFKQINDFLETGKYEPVSIANKIDAFFEYLQYAKEFKIRFTSIKQQAMSFTKGIIGSTKIRAKISFTKSLDDLNAAMKELYLSTFN